MVWLPVQEIVIFILVLAAAILFFPVDISVDSVRSGGKARGSFSISWIILAIKYTLEDEKISILIFNRNVTTISQKKKPPGEPDKKEPDEKEHKDTGKAKKIPPVRKISQLVRPVLGLIRDILSAFRIKYLNIDLIYGLYDPAYTGILTGYLSALKGIFQTGSNIMITPVFTKMVFDWDIRAKVSFTPVNIVLPFLRFITDMRVLRSAWGIIRD